MDAILDALEKSYEDVRALDGMSFSVPAGQVFGPSGRTAPASRRPYAPLRR